MAAEPLRNRALETEQLPQPQLQQIAPGSDERGSDEQSAPQPVSAAPFFWSAEVCASFPPAFRTFLQENNIHPDNYSVASVPRYLRVSPRATLSQSELEQQLQTPCEAIGWLPGFFRLRGDVKIAGTHAYRSGHIYGIDLASGAAVAALDPQPGDHVLDLCCAPGAKLCALADAMRLGGSVTGVDISEERLAACRTLCTKYGICNARLFVGDGSAFNEPPPRLKSAAGGAVAADAVSTEQMGAAAAAGKAEAASTGTEAADGTETASGADAASKVEAPSGAKALFGLEASAPLAEAEPEPPSSKRRRKGSSGKDRGLFLGSALMAPVLWEGPVASPSAAGRAADQAAAEPGGTGACGSNSSAAQAANQAVNQAADQAAADPGGTGACSGNDAASPPPSEAAAPPQPARQYDKVLVDAECTHDGSIKHLAKFQSWGWETFERRFLDPERIASLQTLQLALLRNGFRLLRAGGALVYSTCSFARGQNEAVVEALLSAEPRARLLPVRSLERAPCRVGGLEHTLRFDPRSSQSSALFVARIGKAPAGGRGSSE